MKTERYILIGILIATVAGCGMSSRSTDSTAKRKKVTPIVAGTPSPTPAATAPADNTGVTTETYERPITRMYVNVNIVNVRDLPSKSGKIVTKLKFLDPVTITGQTDGDWVEVELNSDSGPQRAWVHNTLVSVSEEQAQATRDADDE